MLVLLALILESIRANLQVNRTILNSTPGLATVNVTINGTTYYNVNYVNITGESRVAIDIGAFTIPEGCYPCLGENYCINIYYPYMCSGAEGCDWDDQNEECENMFDNVTQRVQNCEECQLLENDYCIVEDKCVTSERGACLNFMDQITVSEVLAAVGYSMDCADAANIGSISFGSISSITASVLSEYTGVFVTAGITIFMIFTCIIYIYRERKERQIFICTNEEDKV